MVAFDVFYSKDLVGNSLLEQLKSAARMSKTSNFWLCCSDVDIETEFNIDQNSFSVINFFGSDLNHIDMVFANKRYVLELSRVNDHILYPIKSNTMVQTVVMASNSELSETSEFKIQQYTGDFKEAMTELRRDSINEWIWVIKPGFDYSKFDFSWRPDPWNTFGWHSFGSQAHLIHRSSILESPQFIHYDFDRRIDEFVYHIYDIKGKLVVDMILELSMTQSDFWLYDSSLVNLETFPWLEMQMKYKNLDGIISFLDKDGSNTRFYFIRTISRITNLNEIDMQYEKSDDVIRLPIPMFVVDTLEKGIGIPYSNYLNALISIDEEVHCDYFWMVSNHMDLSKIDFNWFPDLWNEKYQQVFATGLQNRGDIFLFNRMTYDLNVDQLDKIGNFKFLKSIADCDVAYKVHSARTDNLTELMKTSVINEPWGFVFNESSSLLDSWKWPNPCYWYGPRIETWGDHNSLIMYHKSAKEMVQNEIYDFPIIIKHRYVASIDNPNDVIFLSNGEINADVHFYTLQNYCPRAIHIKGIQGREQSYKAMARYSNTDWFFAVFAKLAVSPDFNWNWQPDRLQAPKNYIFQATNCLNGLEYGHMAIVAANKNIIMNQNEYELDFTLGGLHSVLPINSGTAFFNDSEESTWRTAFRECVKLTHAIHQNNLDLISFDRLNTWLTYASGSFDQWCLKGANDGYEYAKKFEGDINSLKLTREWCWLRKYYSSRYLK